MKYKLTFICAVCLLLFGCDSEDNSLVMSTPLDTTETSEALVDEENALISAEAFAENELEVTEENANEPAVESVVESLFALDFAPELKPESAWTYLAIPYDEVYGKRKISIPAAQNWVSSNLYLLPGDIVRINAKGKWRVNEGGLYSANGLRNGESIRGCKKGQLVARIGLLYEQELACIGERGTFTAASEGILYLGANVSSDLSEIYESRADADGEIIVTLRSSSNKIVPTILASEAEYFPYYQLDSGWVEILGEHTLLTLPIQTAEMDSSKIASAIKRLDDIYEHHHDLRGIAPYQGQPIRWFPDENAPGWLLAGNPVRMDDDLIYGINDDRITLLAEPDHSNWGPVHELGHNFNFAGGDWYYTTFGGLEAWPNIFTVYAFEKLSLEERNLNCETNKEAYLSDIQSPFNGNVWLALCFFMELKDIYGWQFYKDFYSIFNDYPGYGWSFLRERFSLAAGEDVNYKFDEWYLPNE